MANQWDSIALRNINRLTETGQKSFIAASQSAMFRSPFDTGLFKNNWFTEINGVSTKTTSSVDISGSARLIEASNEALRINPGDSISFANSLPYAIPLEYDHSLQTEGNGIIRLLAANWSGIVADVIRGVR